MGRRSERRQAAEGADRPEGTDRPSERYYGVDAEIERLMRCPECGSGRVRPAREAMGGYGVFGFKAIGDLVSARQVRCRNCGHEWLRPPMRDLRREAERRIDERYDAVAAEDERLRRQLSDYLAYQRDIDRQLISPPAEPDQARTAEASDGGASNTDASDGDGSDTPLGPGAGH